MSEVQPLSGNWLNERTHLRKSLRRVDVTFYLLCTLVGLDTIGSVAANGPQGLVWMVILAVVFFLPYGFLTTELGTAFPIEGGPYVWTKLAFGRMAAGVNQVLYWLSNPLWMGGTLAIIALTTFETFFLELGLAGKYIAGLAFIWIGVLAVAASLRIGKWVPIAGAFARIILLGFFTISVVVYAIKNGVQPLAGADFVPTWAGFVALVPVLIFNYVGFELPSTATEEMTDPQKTVPFAILRAGFAAFLLYGGPILGILLVVPAAQIQGLGGFIDAAKQVLTVYGGSVAADGTVTLTGAGAVLGTICAAGLIIGVLTSGVSWAIGAHRAQAVACADGSGPAYLGKLSSKPRDADSRERPFRTARVRRAGDGAEPHRRQLREVLHRRARAGDLDDVHQLPADVPVDAGAAAQDAGHSPAVPRTSRCADDGADDRSGGLHGRRADLAAGPAVRVRG